MTKDFLIRLAEEHYGTAALPVYGRLLKEWQYVQHGPLVPMWHCAASLRQTFGADVLVLGCTNDSLLAHLLGATPVNPLPPHYHCPSCHHFAFAPAAMRTAGICRKSAVPSAAACWRQTATICGAAP